jgi:hypothetical protein
MIKRASSSEIFDLYAAKMISKRAGLRLLDDLFDAASKIGTKSLDDGVLDVISTGNKLGNLELDSGIRAISKIDEVEATTKIRNLVHSAHITEGAEEILKAANKAGYAESDVMKFLETYADDFKKMSSDYDLLTKSGAPTEAQIVKFVQENEKAIKFFNQFESAGMQRVLSSDFAEAGERVARSGKKDVSMADAGIGGPVRRPRDGGTTNTQPGGRGNTNTPPTPNSTSSKADNFATNVGNVISITGLVTQLSIAGAVIAGTIGAWNYISGKVAEATRTSEEHFQKVKDAIGCIDKIELEPGSPAVEQREEIKENLRKVLMIEDLGNNPDNVEAKAIFDSGIIATKDLMGSGKGSLAVFVKTISEHPMDNLQGFFKGNKYTSVGTGALAGGLAGFKMQKTLVGAAIGAAIGGFAGYKFLGDYYDDEVTCVLEAGDAIKKIDEAISKYLGVSGADGAEEGGQTGGTAGAGGKGTPSGTRQDSGASTDDISFLERILSVGATRKLIGIPGFELTNEVKLTESYIMACGGTRNAAEIVLMKNPNIKNWIDYIRSNDPALITAPVDENLSKNKSGKSLLQSLYLTMQATFKNAVRGNRKPFGFTPGKEELSQLIRAQLAKEGINIISQASKNNLNKMKKTSNSINNQELIRKAAETRVSYFGDANLGLKEQLTKSYYAGLTDMYNEKPQKRSSDYKDLYGFQEETGEDLVLQSHPKSVTLADAMGKGGLVENGLEQKEKSTYVALTTPSGNFQSKYASTIGYLNKLAKAADDQGKKEVSKLIRQTIQKLK